MTDTAEQGISKGRTRETVRLCTERVTRAALGEALAAPSTSVLSPVALGCLATLLKHLCAQPGLLDSQSHPIPVKEAMTLLSMRGLNSNDSELVLSSLRMAAMVELSAEVLTFPTLENAVHAEVSNLQRRAAGWVKRAAGKSEVPQGARVALNTPRPAPTQVAAVTASVDVAGAASIEQVDAFTLTTQSAAAAPVSAPSVPPLKPARVASSTRQVGGIEHRRFAASDFTAPDADADPVMVRILCEGGKVAEVTEDYTNHLAKTFTIDVLQQVRQAAVWCESNPKKRKTFAGIRRFLNQWLSNAQSDSDVRKAVVGAGNQRNGFGQGGNYERPSAEAVSPAPSAKLSQSAQLPFDTELDDEFADLKLAPELAPSVVAPPAVSNPAPTPVARPRYVPRSVLASRSNGGRPSVRISDPQHPAHGAQG
jgi:hypothetical protein